MPYIEAIIDVVDIKNTNWDISDYEKENRLKINEFISDHNIKRYSIIELSNLILK